MSGLISLAASLRRRNVQLRVRNGQPEWKGATSSREQSAIHADRLGFAAAIGLLEAGGHGNDDAAVRARALWLAAVAREAGIGAKALFDRIDARFGRRLAGPFDLSPDEAVTLAVELRAEVGTRPAIVSTPIVPGDYAVPESIRMKNDCGWTDGRFSALCRRVIKRPGITNGEDDRRVAAGMKRENR